jgi:hypothetical protein
MSKWMNGEFKPKNMAKYAGGKKILYRSSWEAHFMQFLDNNPSVTLWASEPIRIPYRNPFTGKQSSYVPDFLIEYIDAKGKKHVELIEIKPSSQMTLEAAGKSKTNKASAILNQEKWMAAQAFCKAQGITFKVLSEKDLFHQGKK